ncbi:hypothetical protein COCVIDRAFT_100220, partial [Bipolaris victoriae FI3]
LSRLSIIEMNFHRHVASHGIVVGFKGPVCMQSNSILQPHNIEMSADHSQYGCPVFRQDATTFNKSSEQTWSKDFLVEGSRLHQEFHSTSDLHKIVRLCTCKGLCNTA